jgi:serine phosphatase RsbU (regulator of sigma subunit)
MFYRLSWRLAFSYFLIGVFPAPLLALLLGVAAAMSLGQFQAYRVEQAVRQLGARILAGEVTGLRGARIAGGKIVSSELAAFPAGDPAPEWVGELSEPRFFGSTGGGVEGLGVASTRAGETRVLALPVDDLLYARLAELSGVALKPIAGAARSDTRRGGLTVSVDEKGSRRRGSAPFIYPPEAIPADHSSSPWIAVSWIYTSPPVLGMAAPARGEHDRNIVAIFTRLSWRHALSELFAQGAIQSKNQNWALLALVVIGSVLLAVYLVALLIAYLLVRTITKTVNRLSRATRHIATGDFSVRIATRAKDQVGDLARSFDSMAASLEGTLQDRAAKELLDREIEQARLIAQKLLPAPGVKVPGLRTTAFFEPVAQMGGDYYDFLATRGGDTAVAIGDVSGHGLPTALLVAAAKAALDTLLESGEGGTPLFVKLNRLLHRSTDSRNYMTFALATVRPAGQVELTNAGHPPPYLLSNGAVRPLELPAFPLGLFDGKDFPTRSYPFAAGDRLVLYTDGIIECRDSNDDAFGFERFEEVLRANSGAPIEELQRVILEAVARHCASGVFDDDRTLVICERL